MQKVWRDTVPGSSLENLPTKLKKVKVALKTWNIHIFGQVDQEITLEERLQTIGCESVEQELLNTKYELGIWKKR